MPPEGIQLGLTDADRDLLISGGEIILLKNGVFGEVLSRINTSLFDRDMRGTWYTRWDVDQDTGNVHVSQGILDSVGFKFTKEKEEQLEGSLTLVFECSDNDALGAGAKITFFDEEGDQVVIVSKYNQKKYFLTSNPWKHIDFSSEVE